MSISLLLERKVLGNCTRIKKRISLCKSIAKQKVLQISVMKLIPLILAFKSLSHCF